MNYTKRIKRILCSLLTVMMVLMLFGCKKQSAGSSVNKDAVYEAAKELQTVDSDNNLPIGISRIDNKVYVFYRGINRDYESGSNNSGCLFAAYDLTNPDMAAERILFQPQEGYRDVFFLDGIVTEDGRFLMLENATAEDGQEVVLYAVGYSDGRTESTTLLKDADPFVTGSAFLDNGNVAVLCGKTFCLFSPQGEKLYEDTLPEGLIFSSHEGDMSALHNNLIFYLEHFTNEGIGNYVIYDTESRTFGDIVKNDYAITDPKPASDGGFYAQQSQKGIFLFDEKGVDVREILNMPDSGIAAIFDFVIIDANTVFVSELDEESGNRPYLYSKLNPEDIVEKTTVVLGLVGMADLDFRSIVNEFNKNNSSVRIEIKDYGAENNNKQNEIEEAFNLDVVSGNCPDIILTNYLSNNSLYMKKGIFEDLNPYLEASGLNKEDYLPNVMDAGSIDGKQYLLIPTFTVSGLCITKPEYLNGNGQMSISELQALESELGIEGRGILATDRNTLIYEALMYGTKDYCNPETGECRFDSDEFKVLLEWAKTYPESAEDLFNEYHISHRKDFEEQKAIIRTDKCSGIREFHLTDEADFKGEGRIIGFPNKNGDAAGVICPAYAFGISSQSEHKQEAFDFIKTFMEESYQKENISVQCCYVFPSMKSAFDLSCERMLDIPYNYSQNTGLTQGKDSYTLGSENIEVEPMEKEKLEYVKEKILSCNGLPNMDTEIMQIVFEESAPYFSGDKSLDEVVTIIQSRAELYVNENQ